MKLTSFLVPAGSTMYLDLFVRDVGENAVIMIESDSDTSDVSVTLYDGFGGADPNAVSPAAIPYLADTTQTTAARFDVKGTAYTMSSVTGNKQTVAINIKTRESGDWVSVAITNSDTESTEIQVYCKVR